jgi:hypothetical protein
VRRRQTWPVWGLVGWTLFVWGTRIGTIWSDDDLDAVARVGRTLLVASFLVLAALTVAALVRKDARLATVVRTFAVWTAGVWVVRMVAMATGDHSTGFVVVHGVLALVSVVLAGLAWRATLPARHGTASHRHRGAVDAA